MDKSSLVQLREMFSLPEVSGILRKFITIMMQKNFPVLCINRSVQRKRILPFKTLFNNNHRFWQQKTDWEYFITKEDLADVKNKALDRSCDWEVRIENEDQSQKKIEQPPIATISHSYGAEYETIAAMTNAERVQRIDAGNERLSKFIVEKSQYTQTAAEVLVDVTRDTALVNHAAILDAMDLADDEAKKITQSMVDSTHQMVRLSSQLVLNDILNHTMMSNLVEKSNGTIIHHIIRVYLNGIAFLSYYNKLVSSSSSAITKLRISFPSKYRDFYCTLLPHLPPDDVTLERVFYRGMRSIPLKSFFNWGIGFLLHDIGKAAAVEYHEGEAAYNREIVVDHVKLGYTAIMNKTNYPRGVGLIAGYHHEYYGDAAGYGYFRSGLEQHKKMNPKSKQDYCISYELEPVMNYETLAYFPAKVLEIIDIFDSVTDPNRKYRKPMNPEDALVMMREEFIEKSHRIDPILFDMFVEFRNENQGKQAG
jgi:hypothetical protein